jgi:thiol-disulfide isomerase/thioredoxin
MTNADNLQPKTQGGPEGPGMRKARRSGALAAAGWLFLAGGLGFGYMLLQGMSKPAESAGLARFATGALAKLEVREAPPLQSSRPFKDATGAQRTLAAYRGKVTLVNFWATWCAPCVKEMPTLAALDQAFDGRGFEVVAISLDRLRDADLAQQKLAELTGGRLEFLIDTTMTIAPDSGAQGMPTTILYDANGQELARLAGEADWAAPEAKALIEAALAAPG